MKMYQDVSSSSPFQHPHLGCQAAGPSDSHGRQPAALTGSRKRKQNKTKTTKTQKSLRKQCLQEQLEDSEGQQLLDKAITMNLHALESAVSARAISSHCNVKEIKIQCIFEIFL